MSYTLKQLGCAAENVPQANILMQNLTRMAREHDQTVVAIEKRGTDERDRQEEAIRGIIADLKDIRVHLGKMSPDGDKFLVEIDESLAAHSRFDEAPKPEPRGGG